MRILTAASLLATALCGVACASGQRVVFPSVDGDLTGGQPTQLSAMLFRPDGSGRFPAVVALHGCGGLYRQRGRRAGTLGGRHEDWAERLAASGYVVLMPDSFGPRGVDETCTVADRPVESNRERPRDAYGALRWLQQQPFVRADAVALLGWSNGGGTVLNTVDASQQARPPAPDFRAAVAFYPGCADPDKSARARRWRARVPLLILGGDADDWTPNAPCEALAAAARARGEQVTFISYPGAYHGFDAPDEPVRERSGLARAPTGRAHVGTDPAARADALQRVPAFLKQHLGP